MPKSPYQREAPAPVLLRGVIELSPIEPEFDGFARLENTVWFSFVAPASGAVEVTTCGSETTFDTQLAIYTATDCDDYSTFELLSANDDFPLANSCTPGSEVGIYSSYITACGLTEGETYYVQVDGYNGETGTVGITATNLDESACTARLQVVHNSPDAAAFTVDVRVNGDFPTADFDDVQFRTATPTIDAPAGVALIVTVNPSTSVDESEAFLSEELVLIPGGSYQVIAQGLASPLGYNPGPDVAPLELQIIQGYLEANPSDNNTFIAVSHGATDAPNVDVDNQFAGTSIIEDLPYGEVDGYVDVPADNLTISVTAAGSTDIVGSYVAPLASANLGGGAITVFASGFLDPAQNSDGPSFGLWASLPEGGALIPLEVVTGVEEIAAIESLSLYPNPSADQITVDFELLTAERISIDIVNLVGKTVLSKDFGQRSTGANRERINLSQLAEGFYVLNMHVGSESVATKIQVQR